MRLVTWVVLAGKGGRKVADNRAASAEKDGHREVLTQLPASRLVVEALVGKVADHKEALAGKGGLKAAGKREALVVKVADRRKVLGAKVGRKAAGRRVAKAARKEVAFQVVLLPLAFQVEASHNPDKDSTW